MPRLIAQRTGQRVQVKGRQIDFSFWPSRPGRRHRGLQSLLFALDPWAIIRQTVERECLPQSRRVEALATLEQAEDFFVMGTERGTEAAQPLALYYSYMNLSKTFCLTRGPRATFDQAQHGLKERLNGQKRELIDATLIADLTTRDRAQNFAELLTTLTGAPLAARKTYDLPALLPQILPGHRLWAHATRKVERFIAIDDLQFWQDTTDRSLWLRIYLLAEDLSRLGVSHQRMLSESGLAGKFREVQSDIPGKICLEQKIPQPCPDNYPADDLHHVVAAVRPFLWMTVTSIPPYRRYYIYLCPINEVAHRLPQLLSIYAMTFYLGSITRYRPHHFDALLRGTFGPRVRDFVTGQPLQFLYLMASEIAQRDVTKPSIL